VDLEGFRTKVGEYRRLAGRTQQELARELELHPKVLSHKLHGSDAAYLTHDEVRGIIRILAAWRAIWERGQAEELLSLMGLSQGRFAPQEWAAPPLSLLEPETRGAAPNRASHSGGRGWGASPLAEHPVGTQWLVRTKLAPPTPLPDTVRRARLLDSVRSAVSCRRLVLVSAPAGSGKTTLVAEASRSIPALRSTWVSLDAEDSDPARFLTLLVAAFERLDRDCAAAARVALAELPDPGAGAKQIVGALINGIAEGLAGPVALVLDDLHRIAEPAVYVALGYLIERLPPQLHVVAISRHDPPLALSRLRARGELAEFRFADLRFTPDETSRLLAEMHVRLRTEDVEMLQARTEGWAAGVRLAAGALAQLRTPGDQPTFLSAVARTDRHLFDFLADEVLHEEDPTLRMFLLETSILPRLTPDLCRAVTGRSDSANLLDLVERRNLFVFALDDARERTLRYHDLFRDFLRRSLEREMPRRVAELHRRAADSQSILSEAIPHLLAGRLWAEAAGRIEEAGGELLREGLLQTVRGWLEALPAEVRESHPRLLYLLGVCAWRRGTLAESTMLLRRSVEGFARADDAAGRGEALAYLVSTALMEGDAAGAESLAEEALSLPLSPRDRVQLLLERGRARLWHDDRSRAIADLDSAIETAKASAAGGAMSALLTHLHPIYASLPGGVDRTERVCRLAAARLGNQTGPLGASLEAQWAQVHLWRGRFDACLEAGDRVLAIREEYGSANPLLDIWVVWSLAVVHTARAEHSRATHYFNRMFHLFDELGMTGGQRAAALYSWGWACWLRGRHDEAEEAHRRMGEALRGVPSAPILRAMLGGLIRMSEGRYEAAEESLGRAIDMNRGLPPVDLHGNPRLLLAHLYLSTGRPSRAIAEFEPVLAACEAEDAPGLVLKEGPPMLPLLRLAAERGVVPEFAGRLLEQASEARKPRPVRLPETGETLSAREVEVLRLLATGATNREIAAELVVGEQTVKTHVSRILQKLDVPTRRQAAAWAQQLGLL
jgi:LuxR family maltose regulon positive regulatory protein